MADPAPQRPSLFQRWWAAPLVQAFLISGLVLVLQIPVLLIHWLVAERSSTRQSAISEVSNKWGRSQRIAGPFLIVPYRFLRSETDEDGNTRTREVGNTATFLPRKLVIEGELQTEVRYRGIFEAPVYRSNLRMEGVFDQPDFSSLGVEPVRILWDRAQVIIEVTDARAVQNSVQLEWNGQQVDFEPGSGLRRSEIAGMHAPMAGMLSESEGRFAIPMELNGSVQLHFTPLGKETRVKIEADWPDPSFQGNWLPVEREVRPDGFTARWQIPYLGRNYPQGWAGSQHGEAVAQSHFGVDLISPVDAYRQTERSLKYQLLFLTLTFVTVWLFEVLAGVRLHPIHYTLIGVAMCLFYLLELSLAEHVGFPVAYTVAAAGIVSLVCFYALSILGSWARAGLVCGVLVALYACLYVLIQLQDYALLVGSAGLFLILAAIMYLTRNVNWFAARTG